VRAHIRCQRLKATQLGGSAGGNDGRTAGAVAFSEIRQTVGHLRTVLEGLQAAAGEERLPPALYS